MGDTSPQNRALAELDGLAAEAHATADQFKHAAAQLAHALNLPRPDPPPSFAQALTQHRHLLIAHLDAVHRDPTQTHSPLDLAVLGKPDPDEPWPLVTPVDLVLVLHHLGLLSPTETIRHLANMDLINPDTIAAKQRDLAAAHRIETQRHDALINEHAHLANQHRSLSDAAIHHQANAARIDERNADLEQRLDHQRRRQHELDRQHRREQHLIDQQQRADDADQRDKKRRHRNRSRDR